MSKNLRVRIKGLERVEIEEILANKSSENIISEITNEAELKLSNSPPEFILNLSQESIMDILKRNGVMVKSCSRPDKTSPK
ncbi:hypothetical protein [Pseudomonas citronellolis]|uniref:hypothetical protein n=1 Tax=Pseudomonas citronellolis TaxID=53408 RepID=UPI0012FE3A60|nr:hypothetical protein [Pseudomonas citronellolis]